MHERKNPHILNAASNLIGVCFVILAGIRLIGSPEQTVADEIAIVAAVSFMVAIVLSYISIRLDRSSKRSLRYEHLADYAFLVGLVTIFIAIVMYSVGLI